MTAPDKSTKILYGYSPADVSISALRRPVVAP
jgi:hypothetical protein